MKRILLDQGRAPRAAAILRRNGLDALHVSEIGMEQAEDVRHVGPRFPRAFGDDGTWPPFGGTAACPGT